MQKDLRRIKNNLITIQLLVFLIVLGGSLFLFSTRAVNKVEERWRLDIEDYTLNFAHQLKTKLEQNNAAEIKKAEVSNTIQGDLTPEEYELLSQIQASNQVTAESDGNDIASLVKNLNERKKDFNIMVVDKQSEFVVSREESTVVDQNIWKSHQMKLLYEFKKQRSGWAFYPEIDEWDYESPQWGMRYVTLDQFGLTVIVESYKNSRLEILRSNVDKQLYMTILGVFIICFIVMRVFINWMFKRADRVFNNALNNNVVRFKSKPIKGTPKAKPSDFVREVNTNQIIKRQVQRELKEQAQKQPSTQQPPPQPQQPVSQKADEPMDIKPAPSGESVEQWFYQNKQKSINQKKSVEPSSAPKSASTKKVETKPAEMPSISSIHDTKLPLLRKLLAEIKTQ